MLERCPLPQCLGCELCLKKQLISHMAHLNLLPPKEYLNKSNLFDGKCLCGDLQDFTYRVIDAGNSKVSEGDDTLHL